MTIEPTAVRFTFGTSVRTWATDDKPPMPIIANLFRDMDESDAGLTPAVEEIAGAVMRRRARWEGNSPERVRDQGGNHMALADEVLLTFRMRNVLVHLSRRETLDTLELAALAHLERDTVLKMCYRMMERGAITSVRPGGNKPTLFTITDIGRRAMETGRLPPAKGAAHKVAAE
jgi:DNA-binding MarR family transcriptional regulator